VRTLAIKALIQQGHMPDFRAKTITVEICADAFAHGRPPVSCTLSAKPMDFCNRRVGPFYTFAAQFRRRRPAMADYIPFPGLNHAIKCDPRSGFHLADSHRDFRSLLPEALHQVAMAMSEPPLPIDGPDDYGEQPGHLFRMMNNARCHALYGNRPRAPGDIFIEIEERHVANCTRVDPAYGAGVAAAPGFAVADAAE
jgi:hypothetical protein